MGAGLMRGHIAAALLASLLAQMVAHADDAEITVRVLALFPNKAMLEIDGTNKVLAAGETGPRGVRLLSADPRTAVVEIAGERRELRLGTAVSAVYSTPERREVRIVADATGSYFVDGLVNGQSVRFLVDTGATSVAMSESHARRLGLQHRLDGQRIGVNTASGSVGGYHIVLDNISVGGIRLRNVEGVVIDGDNPRHVLLGMSALGRFELDQRSNLMILRGGHE
jgi:aspartyl protease family protein